MPLDSTADKTSVSETGAHRPQRSGLRIFRFLQGAPRAVADSLTKKLFLAAYEASDDAYWRRHAIQCEWQSLGGIIEYTPDLLTLPRERAAPAYLIAVRASSNTYLKRVTINVKARTSGAIHEQKITLDDLCDIPVSKALTVIPQMGESSKGAARRKLGRIRIKLVEAVDGNGVDLAKDKRIAEIFPLTRTDAVPQCQVERWGQYWNIDLINVEKENISTRCYQKLIQSARTSKRPLTLRKLAYRLLTSQVGLALLFWSQNLGNAEDIRAKITQAEGDSQ